MILQNVQIQSEEYKGGEQIVANPRSEEKSVEEECRLDGCCVAMSYSMLCEGVTIE